jgi:hypothetical protein
MEKFMQLIEIVLLYFVVLDGSEDILGKQRAWLSFPRKWESR